MVSPYILVILLVLNGGSARISAEFPDRDACIAAKAEFVEKFSMPEARLAAEPTCTLKGGGK